MASGVQDAQAIYINPVKQKVFPVPLILGVFQIILEIPILIQLPLSKLLHLLQE